MSRVRARLQQCRIALEELESRTAPALVAAYGFEEGSGTTAVDSSGRGNRGTLAGPARRAGKLGQALSFNGAGNLVNVADSNSLDLTNGMTLEAWVYPTAASDSFDTVVLKERGTTSLAYALYAADGAGRPPSTYINIVGSDRSVAGTSNLSLNTWSHLAATYNGSALRLYVNGTQVATRNQTGNAAATTNALRIGGNTVWGEYFAGLIDEVRVYNTALTQAQIQTDMSTPVVSGPDITPPTVSVSAPANNATVAGSVTVSANASDNVGVVGVLFKLDGNVLGVEDTTAPYSVSWNTSAASDGTHVLTAVARDAAGYSTTSAAITVTVANTDTSPPAVALTAPTSGATVTGSITVSASASDNVGVVGVQFQVDGANLGAEDTTAPYSINW